MATQDLSEAHRAVDRSQANSRGSIGLVLLVAIALVGAAVGLLLDAAAIPWRGQMAEGRTPFDLLAAAFPVAEGERDALVAQGKAGFGYDELLARAAAARR